MTENKGNQGKNEELQIEGESKLGKNAEGVRLPNRNLI